MARKQVAAAKPAEEITMTEPIEEPGLAGTEPEVEETAPAEPAVEETPAIVANETFTDSLTGRSFRVGDVVEGWNIERAQAYALRGLVRLVGPSLTSETGPSEVA